MDKGYKKSLELYLALQVNLIKELELNLINSENMIEVHTKNKKLVKSSLIHEKKMFNHYLTLLENEN